MLRIESVGIDEDDGKSDGFGKPIIDDEENGVQYFAGGRWVTEGENPEDHYPDLVRDGHDWVVIDE